MTDPNTTVSSSGWTSIALLQAQQLYEFFVTTGYDDMWGTKP